MTNILKTLLPVTAALVFSTLAYGQDAAPGTGSAPAQGLKSLQNPVIRYSAGDSIPLGQPLPAAQLPLQEQKTPVQTHVVRYSAGDSIVLGHAVQVKEVPLQEQKPLMLAQVGRYSAGDSIALGAPQPAQLDGTVEVRAPHAKIAGFSKAAQLPLAGALADSVTTHIGLNQPGIAEKNGLINTSPAGLLGLFVIKAGIIYYFDQQPPELRKSGLKATAGVWNGVALNNILLIAGASNPLSIVGGALFGAYMYHREGQVLEKEHRMQTAQASPVQAR